MNRQESDILNVLLSQPYVNQRTLSEVSGHSLGIVNQSIKRLVLQGFLDEDNRPTELAIQEIKSTSPRNAIILAAGFGMRMVPINFESPKALIEVHGEPLIERIINQLHEAEIDEIYVVVGFMKEKFEYLIDEFGVKLIVNDEYASKNNLHSLRLAAEYLSNTYIIPCDIWCSQNPFHRHEGYSWYMISDSKNNSIVRVNRKMEIVKTSETKGNYMIGISYLAEPQCAAVREKLREMDDNPLYNDAFWEETLYKSARMIVPAKVVCSSDFVEINTYEQLRELDENSNQLKSNAIDTIAQALESAPWEITDITVLKKGMTNRSFLFRCKNKKYIMRIPGEGTDQLINRREETEVYDLIAGKGICDNIVYINPENGYKITEFFENARVCDANNVDDLRACMKKLKEFHDLGITVNHEFNIFKQIDFYESLWDGRPSVYRDYSKTKEGVFSLRNYITLHAERKCLVHIDAVPDNFLFTQEGDVRLIDWEYAGMQDPHVDIAMFCIYALYDKKEIDQLIDIYFEGKCSDPIRVKIYCYIAACGLLWSNWCEYKRNLGIEFGAYSLCQYRYAKDYYKIAKAELEKIGD